MDGHEHQAIAALDRNEMPHHVGRAGYDRADRDGRSKRDDDQAGRAGIFHERAERKVPSSKNKHDCAAEGDPSIGVVSYRGSRISLVVSCKINPTVS